ncbi:uncharacterized protein GGS22DRAFT_159187 [Annulohypoxylon maeteangense]|uniref:uncharacterized protein n=1 Tax=Annulohypoxylon maeteangense TaxID=1927788 RepID=UPI002007CD77|nr:uncharacterized protein GGS22DRAFT_159187 [Annulohypoxylon maeteangense]KAI0887018.1 hypothetical protein GGS22DRAFT_159187 [Annulohypoxylon maeteangense]
MTETSPQLLATANLTPLSPAPLHPSSPVVVPALQDQADTLYTMSLSDGDQVPSAAVAGRTSDVALASNQTYGSAATANYQSGDPSGTSEPIPYLTYFEVDDDGYKEEETPLVKDDRNDEHPNHDQHNGAAGTSGTEAQQDVSRPNASALSSDLSESQTDHSEVNTSTSHDLSLSIPVQHVHQPVPNTSHSSPQEAQEPREPQEQAVVASSSITHTQGAPQPPTETAAEETEPKTEPESEAQALSSASSNDDNIDIQDIVDKIIGNSSTGSANQSSVQQISANASSVSLPPRPPMPQQPPLAQPHARLEDVPGLSYQPGLSYSHATGAPSSLPPPPGTYSVGAPGTALEARNTLPPPPPSSSLSALPAHPFSVPQFDPTYVAAAGIQSQSSDQSQPWETFLHEERRYVSEAKWDRFPEGSRLFIGNLSSDRVSKKEVFDLFSKYGRLAQISLKQAYGFVQYHTLMEGQAAMDHLQGIDVRGRKIHLEFSRTQKKDGDGEKRNNKSKRDTERHDAARGRRDDYRPTRQPSPRRSSHRQQNSYDSGRGYYDDYGGRGRSRSPSYGRRDSDHYRRRSPSPYRRHASEAELDIPRRYGGDIPDVQFLVLQEVERDFVSWVERSFLDLGLKVKDMFLHSNLSREAVIQRQVMEGVYAVVELDYQSQRNGTISLQVFNRSSGRDNIRYDQYRDLAPAIAAQLVNRARSQAPPAPVVQSLPPYGGVQYPSAPPQYSVAPQPTYMPGPPSYSSQPYPSAQAPPTSHAQGSLDNATLQKILGTLHSQQGTPSNAPQGYPSGQPVARPPPNQNPNVAYTGAGASNHSYAHGVNRQYNANYPSAPAPGAHGMTGAQGGDPSQHVQTIMAQLARYRQ